MVDVAQLVRASVCGTEGRGFESRLPPFFINMGWFKASNFEWIDIINSSSLDELINSSFENKVLLFKHSTRCSISSLAKSRIESAGDNKKIKNCYYLDLLAFRDLSNKISSDFNINHESPQVLIIEQGKCIAHLSHGDITWDNIV